MLDVGDRVILKYHAITKKYKNDENSNF